MERSNMFHKVTKYMWKWVLFKFKLSPRPVAEHVPRINAFMLQTLAKHVWIETYISLTDWRHYLQRYYHRMNASTNLYATYVIYACYFEEKCSSNACEVLIRVMALAIQMAFYASESRQLELMEYSQEIVILFFERELKKDFQNRGGWKQFHKFLLLRKPTTDVFENLEELERNGKYPQQIVEELGLTSSDTHQMVVYLSNVITEEIVENHPPTINILNSLRSVLDVIRLKYRSESEPQDVNGAVKKSVKKLTNENASSDGKTTDGKAKIVLYQQPTTLPPKRVTTKEAYLRAKKMLQIIQTDLIMLDELLGYVYNS